MNAFIEKAAVLTEALPFIQQFRGETVVVKFGGSIMENEAGVRNILEDIAFMECVGMHPVVVHGGGKAISKALREAGIFSEFVRGLRVTNGDSIQVVERVLNQQVNPGMVDILRVFDGKARGIHGEDIFRAERMRGRDERTGEALDWGFVGQIKSVDVEPIEAYMKADIVPVITPLARDEAGQLYNVNADDAATAVACALQARKLVFLSDVPGLLHDPADADSLISSLHLSEVEELIDRGVIAGGMLPKIKGMVHAVEMGIRKAHIIDSALPHSLLLELFTSEGVGTEILK
ncbi:MAG: acetylglutamate kinase [Kiritimatiellaceae bacterium]|nr:acetylglutamate kinase [Kiritimatiellaceae bacterium]RZO87335.1 MAG: acetylglutamate kinase [Kiritimatiellaceae bacterium]|tara:strand:- start:338 stop:1210 length:873 start_codon:yes stop_codon:yes gene_type:complete